ncbi:MAG: glycerate kinase [Hyphomicrobiaceae bacterium]
MPAQSPDASSAGAFALLERLYSLAVAAAHPRICLPPHLPMPPERGRLIVVGAGKASAAMAVATEDHYAALGLADHVFGRIATRHGFALPTRRLGIDEAGHPVPDEDSRRAAEDALARAATATPDDVVLVLLSGGASAIWSAPVAGIGFDEKQDLTRALLRAGARISEINTVRRHISRIKGGKLAAAAAPARLLTLAISDVPGDLPEAIGSGPTVADPTTLADARDVLRRYDITPSAGIAAALADPANETLKPGAQALAHARYEIVARPSRSLELAADAARAAGYEVKVLGDALEGEAREVARAHARLALDARAEGRRLAILSGGELTVTVTGDGRGGPNQEYALALAIALDGASGIHAISGDTDGIDGGAGEPTDPAGARVGPDTLMRARANGLDAASRLAANDSTGFFAPLGDLLMPGPTQTNVNDFRAVLVSPPPSR